MPSARPDVARLRGPRATVLAAVAMLLAVTAHLVGGGALPSLPWLVVLTVPLVWGGVALTVRPLGPVALASALGAAQLGLHEALMVLSAPACAASSAGAPGMSGMAGMHAGHGALAASCAMSTMHGPAAAALPASAMLVAHIVATVCTALLLARGEQALSTLLALLGVLAAQVRRLVRPSAAVAARVLPDSTRLRATSRGWAEVARLTSAVLEAAGGRRAPPLAVAAALSS
jgi:hypothetical protein